MTLRAIHLHLAAYLLFSFQAHAMGIGGFLEGGKGVLHGYAQTPQGGSPGTTSFQRPSFEELQKNHDAFWQAGLQAQVFDYWVEMEYLFLNPNATHRLDTPLLTHAKHIPANELFYMQIEYEWYTFSIGKCYQFGLQSWRFIPKLEFNWLHYDYEFVTTTVESSRGFSLITGGLNLDIIKRFNNCWTAFGRLQYQLPLSNLKYNRSYIGVSYLMWENNGICLRPYLKTGIIQLDYEDTQTIPNHIRYTNFPYIALGVSLAIASPGSVFRCNT